MSEAKQGKTNVFGDTVSIIDNVDNVEAVKSLSNGHEEFRNLFVLQHNIPVLSTLGLAEPAIGVNNTIKFLMTDLPSNVLEKPSASLASRGYIFSACSVHPLFRFL